MSKTLVDLLVKYDRELVDKPYLLQPASQYVPAWFKNLPAKEILTAHEDGKTFGVTTAKTCPGIVKLLTKGYIVPCPFDLHITTQGSTYDIAVPSAFKSNVEVHPNSQLNYADNGTFIVLKIVTPYSIRCTEAIDFLYTVPTFHVLNCYPDYEVPNGIFEFKYQHSCNVFIFIPVDAEDMSPREYKIQAGTPIAHIIPLTDKKLSLKYEDDPRWRDRPANTLQHVSSWFDKLRFLKRMGQ